MTEQTNGNGNGEPPDTSHSATDPAWWPHHRKMAVIGGIGAVILVVVVIVVFALGGSMTVRGSVLDESALTGSTCNVQGGSQVLISDSSDKVLAVTSLHENSKMEHKLESSPSARAMAGLSNAFNGLSGGAAVDVIGYYTFTATIPSGDAPYGIKVGDQHVVWFTGSQMGKGPGLTCG